jgi:hypothetical protein
MTDAPETAGWRSSSRCEAVNCVEVLLGVDQIAVRNSVHPDGPRLKIDPADWTAFIEQLKNTQPDGSRSISGADKWSTS